jgi:hypothetical protein
MQVVTGMLAPVVRALTIFRTISENFCPLKLQTGIAVSRCPPGPLPPAPSLSQDRACSAAA